MILLDSSFLVAFYNESDVHHREASEAMDSLVREKWGQVLLSEHVFLEVTTVLMARRNLKTAVSVGTTLLQAKEIEFVPSSEYFLETFETFRTQPEPSLSFADSALVAIARRQRVEYLATFDTDFRRIPGLRLVP